MNGGRQELVSAVDSEMVVRGFVREAERPLETEGEIVEDLVQMMTFQKLNFTSRTEAGSAATGQNIVPCDLPKVRARRARTVAAQSRPAPLESRGALETIVPHSRPRKHSHDGSTLDNRRKRSFSMCESDEDDELASLSSTASHTSAKHQKLRDDSDVPDEIPHYLPSDSIFGASSVSSNSVESSASSLSSLPYPTPTRMGVPRVSFPINDNSGWGASSCTVTPSSSSPRSSPRSGTSSPHSGLPRTLPSVFKRAQSDGEVLLRTAHRTNADCTASPTTHLPLPPGSAMMDMSPQEPVHQPSAIPTEQNPQVTWQHISYPSGNGRRSVSASSLPTTFRAYPSPSSLNTVTFCAAPSCLLPGVVKPIALSPPARKTRKTDSPAVFVSPPTVYFEHPQPQ